MAGTKAILFAFIDDWSRALVGWRWGQAEDTVRLEAAFRRGLEAAGVPQAVFVDRGSAFVSGARHLERVLVEFIDHYNQARPCQGIEQHRLCEPADVVPLATGLAERSIASRRDRLGGIIHEYSPAA